MQGFLNGKDRHHHGRREILLGSNITIVASPREVRLAEKDSRLEEGGKLGEIAARTTCVVHLQDGVEVCR